MNEIQVFNNTEFGDIRTIEQDGKIWFCGKDVAMALGYKRTADAIAAHCKGVCEMPTPTSGGVQKMKYISEGDIYRLITHSELPEAERFERWVFDEVLPTIRRHGMYARDELLDNPDIAIAAFTALKEERERRKALETTVAVQTQQIQELTPKRLPFYIAGITKEKPEPRIRLYWVPNEVLEEGLAEVRSLAPRFQKIKNGEMEPMRCGDCNYCRFTETLAGPVNFLEECEVYEVE